MNKDHKKQRLNKKITEETEPITLLIPDYEKTYSHALRQNNQKKTRNKKKQSNQQNPVGSDMAGTLNDSLDTLDNREDTYNPHDNENNSEE